MFLQPVKFWSILVMFGIKRTLNQAQHSNSLLPNFELCHLKMNLIISHIYVHGSLGCVTIKTHMCVALEGLREGKGSAYWGPCAYSREYSILDRQCTKRLIFGQTDISMKNFLG